MSQHAEGRDELVLVFTAPSAAEGYLAKGRLETEGIPVFMKGAGEGPYPVGPARLWVPSAFEVKARRILDEVASGSSGEQEFEVGPPDA